MKQTVRRKPRECSDGVHTERTQLLRQIQKELRRATVRELELIWVFARNLHLK